jgi:hypothetical protein
MQRVSGGANEPYKLAVYSTVGTSQEGLTGHVFVQLRHGSTNEICQLLSIPGAPAPQQIQVAERQLRRLRGRDGETSGSPAAVLQEPVQRRRPIGADRGAQARREREALPRRPHTQESRRATNGVRGAGPTAVDAAVLRRQQDPRGRDIGSAEARDRPEARVPRVPPPARGFGPPRVLPGVDLPHRRPPELVRRSLGGRDEYEGGSSRGRPPRERSPSATTTPRSAGDPSRS